MQSVSRARPIHGCVPFLVGAIVLLLAGGCEDDENLFGPCYHENQTPIVAIASAAIAGTGDQLSGFHILSIVVDGHQIDLASVTHAGRPHDGVEYAANMLNCVVPCGFGDESGYYEMVIEADGVPQQTVSFSAQYAQCWGSCPSFCAGATAVNLQLEGP